MSQFYRNDYENSDYVGYFWKSYKKKKMFKVNNINILCFSKRVKLFFLTFFYVWWIFYEIIEMLIYHSYRYRIYKNVKISIEINDNMSINVFIPYS